MRRDIDFIGFLLWAQLASFGQAPSAYPTFEVASVRASAVTREFVSSMVQGGPGTADPGRITFPRNTLQQLLTLAYRVYPDQILGPGWLADKTYDIVATVPPGASKEDVDVMLQNLLVERFRLTLHHETRRFPVYVLTVARSGVKLKETAYPNARPATPGDLKTRTFDESGFPKLPPGVSGSSTHSTNGVNHSIYQAYPLARLVSGLDLGLRLGEITGPNTFAPARIVDKTGLTGEYDFTLEYASRGGIGGALAPGAPGSQDLGAGPTIFEALERQLGLKLEKTAALLDVLVIDHVEKLPTDN